MSDDEDISLYRYTCQRILRLTSGEFALLDAHGEVEAIGPLSDIEPHVLTGEQLYDLAVESDNTFSSGPSQLALALFGPQPSPTIGLRRRV